MFLWLVPPPIKARIETGKQCHMRFNLYFLFPRYDDTEEDGGPRSLLRVNSPLSAAADAWLKWVLGEEYSAQVLALQELPKPATKLNLQFSSLLAPLFFSWIAQFMLPVMYGAQDFTKFYDVVSK